MDEGSGAGLVEQAARLRRLWMACLLDALRLARRRDLRRWERGANVTARAWLREPGHWVGSPRWICEVVGKDLDAILKSGRFRRKVPQRRPRDKRGTEAA